jgi:hypothetical protein
MEGGLITLGGGGSLGVISHYRKQSSSLLETILQSNVTHWLVGILVLGTIGFGVKQSARSSLFTLKSVVVEPLSPHYPLSRETVLELAQVPIGSQSLFDVRLNPIESRLVKHPWVKGVIVGKQFPNTLSLKIVERVPVALLAEASGRVLYLESDGTTFEDSSMVYSGELPVLSGFSAKNIEMLQKLNGFMHSWFGEENLPGLKLSSVDYDSKLGLRAMIIYPMKNQRPMRTVLELGLNLEEANAIPVGRLKKVLDYISSRSQPASKIWLGDGKKIVVKFSRGS